MTIGLTTDPLDAYRPIDGSFDEMVAPDGHLRDHWGRVGATLAELGSDQLHQRRSEAQRLLDVDGVTYNVFDGDAAGPRRWDLDPLPLVVAPDEWAAVEAGVIERSELFNLILTDLYGPRDLIRHGVLPPEVVFAHPGFLRACDGVGLPGAHQLFTLAVDIGRDPAGQPWVLSDRAQAPSGAGYALENRVVVSRVFPSLYRDAEVHRLAPFFRSLRSSLQAVAPPGVDNTRIVVLTPGPWSETAFEHAFLASYLGYPLVQGSDLVVRDQKVWMRSLGRNEPVHVILRRVDDSWCDPLELRPESQLGVAGLVESARLGNVSVVNTLGSGVLENAALLPFLPAISKALLGHELRMPSVPTYWCGDEQSRRHVTARLDQLVIKPIGRGAGDASAFGWELSSQQRDALVARIEAHPHTWIGQEPLALGTVPTLTDNGVEARRYVLRAFTVARGESYVALPGGLTRVAGSGGGMLVSNQQGSLGKDTWVLASEPEALGGFWAKDGPVVPAVEPAASMSARAAENLFWLARYAERAEALVRLLRVVADRRNEFEHRVQAAGDSWASPAGRACVRAPLEAVTHVTTTYPGFVGDGAMERLDAPDDELQGLVGNDRLRGSLAHSLRRMLDATLEVRDQLSGDTWLVVGNLDRDLAIMARPMRAGTSQAVIGRVVQSLLAFAGLAAESMVRDPGWRFMDAGRRLERGTQLTSLLRATLATDHDTATNSLMWESVLTAAESIITYRRRYQSRAQLETMLDLLLVDGGNPRSLAFQLDRLAEDLAELPGAGAARRSEAERLLIELTATVQVADTNALARVAADGTRPELTVFLDVATDRLHRIADALDEAHFRHQLPQRSVFQTPGSVLA